MIAALILAAGGSSRMGRPKQLLTFRGRSLLRLTIDAARGAGCRPVMVVLGAHAELLRAEARGLSVEFCLNENWRAGLAESIRCGIAALRERGDGPQAAVLMACDQPFVSADAIGRLCHAFDGAPGRMIASEYAGTVGVPALFDCSRFDSLAAMCGESGAKALLLADPGSLVRVRWPEGAFDVNTPEDYAKLE